MNPDRMTLEQHASAWWADRGVDYAACGPVAQCQLYLEWAEWAFREFDKKGIES